MSPLRTNPAGETQAPEHPDQGVGHDRPHPMRSLLILGLAALSFALAQTTLVPALAELMHEFNTDASGIAWVLTGYLISAAVFTPIFGRLGDMFGKRRLLVIALFIFAEIGRASCRERV